MPITLLPAITNASQPHRPNDSPTSQSDDVMPFLSNIQVDTASMESLIHGPVEFRRRTRPQFYQMEAQWCLTTPPAIGVGISSGGVPVTYGDIDSPVAMARNYCLEALRRVELATDRWQHREHKIEEEFAPVVSEPRDGSFGPRMTEDLKRQLDAAFDAEPVENGISHVGEQIIEEALLHDGALPCLRDFALDPVDPTFAASTLRCLGRLTSPGDLKWRRDLVSAALKVDDVQIRDAAVQAVENWDDERLVDVLTSHSEPVQWIQEYLQAVITELTC